MEEFNPKEQSKGLGDTIAKITNATGISKLVDKVSDVLGIEDCGCNARRQILNNIIPYKTPKTSPLINLDLISIEVKEGIYLVNQNIYINRDGVSYNYKKGEKILITSNHPIFNDLKIYITIGSLIPE